MKVTAKLNNLRIAPRKTKLVADLIKGMDVKVASVQLDGAVKRTNPYMKKLLESAIANGENNLGLDKDNLYVYDVTVGAGPVLKRWMPKAFGRAGKILKRTSKITIVLEERIEGKGRKTKEELERDKRARLEARKKEEKALRREKEKEEKESGKKEGAVGKATGADIEIEKRKQETKKNWTSRIFRRKSM